MMFAVRRLQEQARKDSPLYLGFIDLTKVYDPVDRILLWAVLDRLGVPLRLIVVIRHIHGVMQACVRWDDGERSEKCDVG